MLAFSEAAENNKEPIVRILHDVFAECETVLEIGSGTGQHAVHFAARLPHLVWQPSELAENIHSLEARLKADGGQNIAPAVALDVTRHPWPFSELDGVFSANVIHILSWAEVEHLFCGVGDVLKTRGTLCLYGPFKYGGDFTTESNERFDYWLKSRDPQSGVRDFEAVDELARRQGLVCEADHPMPANNQLIVWRRSFTPPRHWRGAVSGPA